jgi:hypothetical protein
MQGDRLFIVTPMACQSGNALFCVNLEGAVIWSKFITNGVFYYFCSPNLAIFFTGSTYSWISADNYGRIFALVPGEALHAFEGDTGKPLWSIDLPCDDNIGCTYFLVFFFFCFFFFFLFAVNLVIYSLFCRWLSNSL